MGSYISSQTKTSRTCPEIGPSESTGSGWSANSNIVVQCHFDPAPRPSPSPSTMPDGAAHGSADGDAHRDPVVRAYGRAFVWADIPAFGRYYQRTDRGAHCGAHRGADLQADGAHRGADLRSRRLRPR